MNDTWVSIDFETANHWYGSICAVGMTAVRDGMVTDRFSTLVAPAGDGGFAAYNVSLHGIDQEMVREAPRWPQALRQILDFADGRILVAHNAAFDFGALRAACTGSGIRRPALRYACSLVVARRTWRLLTYRLPFVAEAAGVPLRGQHHDAQDDAEAAALVMLAAVNAHAADGLDDLMHKLHIEYGRHSATSDSWNNCRQQRTGTYRPRPPIPRANPAADPDGPLYGRRVCITGTLASMSRAEAQARLADVGAQATPSVGRRTDVLVVGTPDPSRFAPGMSLSSKHRKAQELLDAGQDIEVVTETDLLELLALTDRAPVNGQA